MTITKNESGKTMELFIEGWVDIVSAPELAKEIDNLDSGIENLILDFKKTEYISSVGIRQIVAAHKKMNGNLTLRNVSGEVMNVLNMSGISKRVHIE
ncbi:MAG: STAS domain-containing protein, partial [Lachnospiraceae bacterium]|nr:STAS domain-containing protein [Lachnospiraceae bacterium]